MDAKKALIITWVLIGLVIAGAVGFFIGRSSLGTGTNNVSNLQGPGQTGLQGGTGGKIASPQPVIQK